MKTNCVKETCCFWEKTIGNKKKSQGITNNANFRKVSEEAPSKNLVLPNNKLDSNTKTKTERLQTRIKKPPSPNEDRVRAKQGLALSKFKFGKKRGPRLISITVIRVPRASPDPRGLGSEV